MSEFFERILLPLDGTEIANQALPYAVDLARNLDAELVLVRIVPDLRFQSNGRRTLPTLDLREGEQQALVDHAVRWLERTVEELALHKVRARWAVDVGDAAERIVASVTESNIDLVVMSSHGRRGVPRLIYGSVATRVLAESPCPVMLVHPLVSVPEGESVVEESVQPQDSVS